jgi:hypothetical protein
LKTLCSPLLESSLTIQTHLQELIQNQEGLGEVNVYNEAGLNALDANKLRLQPNVQYVMVASLKFVHSNLCSAKDTGSTHVPFHYAVQKPVGNVPDALFQYEPRQSDSKMVNGYQKRQPFCVKNSYRGAHSTHNFGPT